MPVRLIGILVVVLAAALVAVFVIARPGGQQVSKIAGMEIPKTDAEVKTLIFEDEVVGTGAEAKAGDSVVVHYTGTLLSGKKFDSSRDRGQPFTFTLGASEVIRGWDQGVVGMRVGGKRRLLIPSELGYGPNGAGGVIPPNAALIFDIELLEVK